MGGKTDNPYVSGANGAKPSTQKDPRTQKAYAYFRVHFSEIAAWIEGGCSVRSVWRAYAERASQPFPGSYSTFLRYCNEHGLAPRRPKEGAKDAAHSPGVASPPQPRDKIPSENAPLRGPKPVGSVLGRLNLYPPPLERPPGFIPSEED